jgi:hypothetical protein
MYLAEAAVRILPPTFASAMSPCTRATSALSFRDTSLKAPLSAFSQLPRLLNSEQIVAWQVARYQGRWQLRTGYRQAEPGYLWNFDRNLWDFVLGLAPYNLLQEVSEIAEEAPRSGQVHFPFALDHEEEHLRTDPLRT